jgi:hypothetical protein
MKKKNGTCPKTGKATITNEKNGALPKIDKLKFWTCPPPQ